MNLIQRLKNLWYLSGDSGFPLHSREVKPFSTEKVIRVGYAQNPRKMAEIIKKKVDPIEEIIKQPNE